jgi:DNA-binding transcriptional regulator PaaX
MHEHVIITVEAFLGRYGAAASELLHFPLMFPETARRLRVPGVPYACLEFLYEVGEGLGLERGTVRTALSRMKAAGYATAAKDGDRTRYRVSRLQLEIMDNFTRRPAKARAGYVLAVYAFEKSQERERAQARSLLEYQGFVRFAQNSYVSASIDVSELRARLRESGLSANVLIFNVPRIESEELEAMAQAWAVPERAAYLEAFYRDVRALIESGEGSDAEVFLRQAAAWVGCIVHVQGAEPPLPEELLPEGYRFRAIGDYLRKSSLRLGRRMLRYYLASNR